MNNKNKCFSFLEREKRIEAQFLSDGPFYHLCTNGEESQMLFLSDEDFKCAMNYVAYCAAVFPDVSIYTFTLMINHFHFILSGNQSRIIDFYRQFRSKLSRYFTLNGRNIDMTRINYQLISIDNLRSLRNEIVYTNRNGYVVDPSCSFFSYIWGAGAYFFNPLSRCVICAKYKDLKYREQRRLINGRKTDQLDEYFVWNDMILPISYCKVDEAEQYFQDAHMYSHMISKNSDAFSEISKRLKDKVFLTYNELYSAISNICKTRFNQHIPNLISPKEKIEMAKYMKTEYNATKVQIRNILKLDTGVLQSLFPSW